MRSPTRVTIMVKTFKKATQQLLLHKLSFRIHRVLLIEDSPEYSNQIRLWLDTIDDTQYALVVVKKLSEGLRYLEENGVDIIMLDLTVSESTGIKAFDKTRALAPGVPIIVMAETEEVDLAEEVLRRGAQAYLNKSRVDGTLLTHVVRHAIKRKRTEKEIKKCSKQFEKFSDRTRKLVNENMTLKRKITELKHVEEALRESEKLYRTFFEQSKDVIFVISRDGKILDFNQASLDFFGYTREEMRTITAQELYSDLTSRRKFQLLIEREGAVQDFEITVRKKDGTKAECLLTATVRYADDGKITGYQGIIRDITERKHAEGQLRGQGLIFENIHDGIIMTDLEGNILSWNPAAERMFGYYQDEVFQKTIELLTTKIIKGTLRDGRWTGEMDFSRKDGTDGVCETTVIPLRDENGNITAVFGVAHDITDRKQAEKEQQRSYDRLRETLIATVNALASTIEMRDPYTAGHQRRVTLLACAIAEEMGLTDDQFDGLRMAGLIHDLGKINVPAEILSKPGRINDIEYSIIRFHPQICHDILKTIELPWPVATIVLQHHERLNGSGYPQGLKDDEIMLEARILAVADVVEAMASHRPYRPALGITHALTEITKHGGTLYDPEVIDACLKVFTKKKFKFE